MSAIQLPQKLAFLLKPARYKVAYGGRGGAKSWGFATSLLALGANKPLRILCAREIQESIADSVHKLLCDLIVRMGLGGFYTIQQAKIVGKNGTEFLFAGLRQQDVHKIKSFEGCDIVWVEEAQAVSKRSWSILTPTIRAPGSEIWVSFNPELDTDETYVRFVVSPPPEAVVVKIGWQDNPWFTKELEDERLACLRRDPVEYDNVWEGNCKAAVDGAIYAAEIARAYENRQVRPCPYDPSVPVHCVWDLGFNDSMAIIMVQRAGGSVVVVNYIEDSFRTLAEYVQDLKAMPYVFGWDFLPHDGVQRDYKYKLSSEEILTRLGRKVRVLARDNVEEGIKLARLMFPRVYFDEQRAAPLLNALKRYRRRIHSEHGTPGAPVHDQYSHGADAFRYLAFCVDQMNQQVDRKPITQSMLMPTSAIM